MAVQPGLSQTWSETPKTGFLIARLICYFQALMPEANHVLSINVIRVYIGGVEGSAVAWWFMPRTPDPEVGGSSPTRVKPCCVLEQGTLTPEKYW